MAGTIKDIAKHTGLSLGTISKFINGGRVREANRDKIERAIKELDFHVNEIARGLKTSKSKTIGIIIPSMENFFCTSLISRVEKHLSKHGYSGIICDYQEDPQMEKEKLVFLINKMVDGIIIVPSGDTQKEIQQVLDRGIPVVTVDRILPDIACDSVVVDNFKISGEAVEYFVGQDHRRIAIICGPRNISTAEERLNGYLAVHEKFRLTVDPDLIQFGDYYMQSGYELCRRLLDLPEPPTAIFATNYDITLGVISALNERNIRIPEQLSLIGFDNLNLSKVIKPALSLVVQPMDQLADATTKLMLERLEGTLQGIPQLVKFEAELVIKDSVISPLHK
ncbi:LacI family DNA-binding transcriptional regulator [Paenibacillus abyssi]|uniref:LacI family transcriptional regulator n=1 Tax=Paenibacillus abyssi TaxID=1340531 RepID=A0A917FV81_9BACL|nr:LacI family DNA-binding transcriptional regulator [Paenibacillus abyssi]GGG05868.1 LacI family transcriptional regulator [Paenibacillus abyssi]